MVTDEEFATGVEALSDGTFTIDGGMLVYGVPRYYGRPIEAHLKPLLVKAGEHVILVDTGIGDPPDRISEIYQVRKSTSLPKSLSEKGLSPDDITMVINTHLHFDHTGHNRLFENALLIAQEEEIRYSASPDRFQKGGYLPEYIRDLKWTPVRGEIEMAPGVTVIPTPGHTPGHQSVVIETREEVVIYTGDVAPLPVNLEKKYIVGVLHNPVHALRSLELLDVMGGWWPGKRKRYIFSHDAQ